MGDIPPNEVGRRLREIRSWRGLSLEAAAGLAGLSFGYLGRLERGEQALTNRRTLEAIAHALRVAPSEFTGRPWEMTNGPSPEAHATLVAFEDALEVCELGEDPGVPVRSWPEIEADLKQLQDRTQAADYAAQGALTPRLLGELHAAYLTYPQLRDEVLLALIVCYQSTAWTTKSLAGRGLPLLAVKAARQCAEELDSPLWLGFAVWLRGHSVGQVSRTQQYQRSVEMADRLTGHLDDQNVIQCYGMLHLNAALAAAVQSDRATAETHLGEAAAIADRMTGDVGGFGGVWFGRINVALWRASIGLELGDGVQAVERAADVPVDAIPSPVRRASFYTEAGRALLMEPRYSDRGISLLLQAEHLTPQRVRSDFFVREAIADRLRSARRDAGGRELRGLAWRLGIAPELGPRTN
ncbi:helix-turn-helix domain-containing protein [Nocardia brevicatena]|uniref:helix-turn-helix domain-containing protein n=1 Tax=Nocardia brevicatena TaxID=37327 RepID=UPI00030A13B0|nr:helix-turn-helix transcriptional regulator [Nocardia brevicatena]